MLLLGHFTCCIISRPFANGKLLFHRQLINCNPSHIKGYFIRGNSSSSPLMDITSDRAHIKIPGRFCSASSTKGHLSMFILSNQSLTKGCWHQCLRYLNVLSNQHWLVFQPLSLASLIDVFIPPAHSSRGHLPSIQLNLHLFLKPIQPKGARPQPSCLKIDVNESKKMVETSLFRWL